MAEMIAVVGESGSGKTTSVRNLNHEETFIISITGKKPGIPKVNSKYKQFNAQDFSGNFYVSNNIDKILTILKVINSKMPYIKNVIIDDYQYLMSFEAMERAKEKSYEKFTEMAQHAYSLLKSGSNMRDDIYFIILTHSENAGDAVYQKHKIKTIGKMLDNVVTLEGLFTYVLFTTIERDEDNKSFYRFITNSDGTNTAKTPMGLFEESLIDNDLNLVIEKIKEYNED